MRDADERLLARADRQGGCVSHRQARAAGLSDTAIARRVAAGTLRRVHRSTYRLTALRREAGTDLWAAHLSVDRSAIGAAGALWRVALCPDPPLTPTLVVPSRVRRDCLRGVRLVRSDTALAMSHQVEGMRVLNCAPALVGVLSERTPEAIDALDRALQRRRVTLQELRVVLDRLGHTRGLAFARRAVAAAADGAVSEAERRAVRALRAGGLGGFRCNARVGPYLVDIAYLERRVAVEIDGFAFHNSPATFREDRERQNALVLAGWTVVRFTWWDVTEQPGRVVAEVSRALAADHR